MGLVLKTTRDSELVSVILPVLDGARFLADALRSVFAQAHRPLEVLVVDGGSTDQTERIARSFDGITWLRQPGRGVADAYNTGLRAARGGWIALIEHDDTWTPDKLSAQLAFMRARPELLYTLTHAELFLEPGAPPPPGYRAELFEKPVASSILSTMLARAEVFDRVGLFNDALRCAGDVDWFARAKDLGVATAVLPGVLLRKRMHTANTSIQFAGNNAELLASLRASILRQRGAREAAQRNASA